MFDYVLECRQGGPARNLWNGCTESRNPRNGTARVPTTVLHYLSGSFSPCHGTVVASRPQRRFCDVSPRKES